MMTYVFIHKNMVSFYSSTGGCRKNTNSLVARLEANAKTDARPKEGLNKTPDGQFHLQMVV